MSSLMLEPLLVMLSESNYRGGLDSIILFLIIVEWCICWTPVSIFILLYTQSNLHALSCWFWLEDLEIAANGTLREHTQSNINTDSGGSAAGSQQNKTASYSFARLPLESPVFAKFGLLWTQHTEGDVTHLIYHLSTSGRHHSCMWNFTFVHVDLHYGACDTMLSPALQPIDHFWNTLITLVDMVSIHICKFSD